MTWLETEHGSYVEMQDAAASEFHENSRNHGFYKDFEDMRECVEQMRPDLLARFDAMAIAEKLCLMHSEISEALEAVRKDITAPDHHVPEFTNFEIELADLEIRRADLLRYLRKRNGEAILAKHAYNQSRPYKHGKAL